MNAAAGLVIATRKSKLALWQAEHVAALLRRAHPRLSVELLPMSTKGDRILDRSLAAIGGKGLFIKELESAIEDGRAHLAVHSMKDMPGDLPDVMMLAAIGGKGLFIKELESAIEDGRAHLAVHSMKDMPGELPDGQIGRAHV